MNIINKVAIIILAYSDYESLEISLACHANFLNENYKFFILQNGRGNYDCEMTYNVAKRYENLYPNNFEVIDYIPPQPPYLSIKELLNDRKLSKYDYICKLDDDVFPITKNWLEELCNTYEKQYCIHKEKLGYITSLVNNNPWGTKRVIDFLDLSKDYIEKYSRDHYVGFSKEDQYCPLRLIKRGNYFDGGAGTIWRLPYLARWVHYNTTLQPDKFIAATRNKRVEEVNNQERYSINCMLFKKDFWNKIDCGSRDDEYQVMLYCKNKKLKIFANLEVPMVHLFFFTQRIENKDLVALIKNYYSNYLKLNFPISLCTDKYSDIENRLKFIESGIIEYGNKVERQSFLTISNKLKLIKYKLFSNITFGKTRSHYKHKYMIFFNKMRH
ncbi:MAG: glycosyltransferase family 2 protein [Succinivibrio sp.]|nr:glycosyltransferase family 2 protein [Succinivibrio sp.]